ncbi:MAG: choice-of-anchor Q domain-containing protein, partial [Planctomycetota bacterium]
IYSDGGTLNIADSVLSDNVAQNGGAILMRSGSLNVSSSEITGNTAVAGNGGGILFDSESGTLSVAFSLISNNQAIGLAGSPGSTNGAGNGENGGNGGWAQGGAIYARADSTTIMNTFVSGNSAIAGNGGTGGNGTNGGTGGNGGSGGVAAGGAIRVLPGGPLTIANTTITGNSVQGGVGGSRGTGTANGASGSGGVASAGGIQADSLQLTNSTVSGNSALGGAGGDSSPAGSSFGGGILTGNGPLSILASTISGNSATFGGGMSVTDSETNISNSTISGNSASFIGGIRALNHNNNLTITHSTIVNNIGGGLEGAASNPNTINATIIAGNTGFASDVLGSLTANYSLIGSTTGASINGTSNLLNVDPILGPLANNGGTTLTHALLEGSPAINAGAPSTSSGEDQTGNIRNVGGIADIGALESIPAVVRTLGVLPPGNSTQSSYGLRPREVVFYRFELDSHVMASNSVRLVIDTLGSTLTPSNDTELGLYDATGNLLATDDDIDGGNLLTRLSFGAGGVFGDLNAGIYYVSLSSYDTEFGQNGFDATSVSENSGEIVINFSLGTVDGGPACDFDGDLDCDGADLNALQAHIATGPADPATFDLTGDGLVNLADRDEWLTLAGAENLASGGAYLRGDANLDGVVDVSDFNIWNSNKFQATSNWTSGDFNADGFVDVSDFNAWNSNKFISADSGPRDSARGENPTHRDDEESQGERLRRIDQLFSDGALI